MKGDINLKINKKVGLCIIAITGLFAFADYVSVVNVESSGGVSLVEEALPVGSITMWGTSTPPTDWLELDGSSIPSEYTELISLYGANLPDFRGQFVRGWDHGAGVDSGRSISTTQDSEVQPLTFKGNAVAGHKHSRGTMEIYGSLSAPGYADASVGYSLSGSSAFQPSGSKTTIDKVDTGANVGSIYRSVDFRASRHWTGSTSSAGGHTPSGTIEGTGAETRPTNISVMYIIKAK